MTTLLDLSHKFLVTGFVCSTVFICGCADRRNGEAAENRAAAAFVETSEPEETAPTPRPKVVVRGCVTKADGEPIANAWVAISGGNFRAPIFEITDSEGNYSFKDVPVGQDYVITVKATGFLFQKPSLVVTVDAETPDIDFVSGEATGS